MIVDSYRRTLTFYLLAIILVASVAYDTVPLQINDGLQRALAALMAGCTALVLFIQRYSTKDLARTLVSGWPLHVYSLAFVTLCVTVHGGSKLSQVIAYTYFAYATYLFVPMILKVDQPVFHSFLKVIAVVSALMAIPSFFGAVGFSSLAGIPLRVKPSYAEFSGIIASAGIFEHAEGHALQMGIGMLCAIYLLQYSGRVVYLICLVMTTAGLVVSQGRAAIYGIGVAVVFHVLPNLFHRSRILFFGTLIVLLTFPYFILPQLGNLPGVSGYLRLERGLSGREEAWDFALYAARQKPWTGHGFMASTALTEIEQKTLRKSGFSGAGTTFHNTFITKAVDLGFIATFLYTLLYLVPLSRLCGQSKRLLEVDLLRNMLLLVLTASIYRDYNIGGVRSTAMISSIFIGLACLWQSIDKRGHTLDVHADISEAAESPVCKLAHSAI
ncbi:MAG: O-antigen ligase family protein [Planctomycetales bacterium]|nr:O-antigen ligase family protein [Planctomycetales bacterium]